MSVTIPASDGAPVASYTDPPVPSLGTCVELFATLALQAGAKVMKIWAGRPVGHLKADRSPVCEADMAAETILLRGLAEGLPDIPVVSEEAVSRGEIPATGRMFILVDPLDGTREFLSDNHEFTVNIALIVDGAPLAGVVYAPAVGRLWLGGEGAACCDVPAGAALPPPAARRPIRARPAPTALTALVSRSHLDPASEEFLSRHGIGERRCAGSSLKFCLLAEGGGDVYPRVGPTMQWDVAAGDAVLRAAGGIVVGATGAPLRYGPGPDGFRSPPFVAWGDAASGIAQRATLR